MNLIFLILLLMTAFIVIRLFLTESTKKELLICDFDVQRTLPLRGMLAISIIMHHYALVEGSTALPVVQEFMSWGGVVVAVFFFITGYGLMTSFKSKGSVYLSSFLMHRLGKILPSLIIATLCFLTIQSIITSSNAFVSIFELKSGITPLPTSWFAYAIIIFYVAFFITAKVFKDYKRIIIVLWIFSTIYIMALLYAGWENCWYKSTYAFNIGFTYAYFEDKIKAFILKHPISFGGCVVASFILLVVIRVVNSCYCYTHIEFWKTFVYYLAPFYVVTSIYMMGVVASSLFRFLGKISYDIYIVQGAFVVLLAPIRENAILYLILLLVLSVFFGWLLNVLCNLRSAISQI